GSSSDPESFLIRHQGRLAMPRDWRGVADRSSEDSSSHVAAGTKQEQERQQQQPQEQRQQQSQQPQQPQQPQQQQLEMDGEWFGDAHGETGSTSEKVGRASNPYPPTRLAQDPDHDSPAMDLLCSITKMVVEGGSTNAPPGTAPAEGDSRRLRKESRRRFATTTGIGGGGAGSSGSGGSFASPPGDFYRLPWYRRPLPSNRRTSVGGGATLRRASSMIVAPRAGFRSARGSTDGGVTAASTPGAGAAPTGAWREGTDATPKQQQRQQQLQQQLQQQQHAVDDLPGCSPATEPGSKPSPAVAHAKPTSPAYMRSTSPVFGAVEDDGGAATAGAPAAAGVLRTPTANSMAADRGAISSAESSGKRGGRAAAAAAAAVAAAAALKLSASPSNDKEAGSDEVKRLKAEVDRLKREMAALAAAAAKETTTPPPQQAGRGSGRRRSPRLEVASPARSPPSEVKHHSSWESETSAVDCSESSGNKRGAARPMSTRLRADNSWMQRRRSGVGSSGGGGDGSDGDSDQRNDRKSGGGPSASTGSGSSGSGAKAMSAPSGQCGDSANNERGRAPPNGGGGNGEAALLSPPGGGLIVEGPSPTSGDKGGPVRTEIKDRRRKHCSIDSIEEASGRDGGGGGGSGDGDGDGSHRRSGSAHSNDASMRQMSVFFPVQTPPESKADSDCTASVEGAAALAAAAATQIGAAISPPEAGRAARAARNAAVSARQQQLQHQHQYQPQHQQGPTQYAPAPPVVYAKIPERGAPAGAETGMCRWRGGTCRQRCGAGDGNGRVWRWVLVQRMGHQLVRQALLTHGLPSCGRRHIWAAWASVAVPEK
ncbi:unnamed protein product, partial [Hapterophycus canaliculatus]